MNILGVNAAAEEERFPRHKHGKACVPRATSERPEAAIRSCSEEGGIRADQLDAVSYRYDSHRTPTAGNNVWDNDFEASRTFHVRRAPSYLTDLLPGLDPIRVTHSAHRMAHAASAYLAGRVTMVDDPRDELECFGSTPVDAITIAIGPFSSNSANLVA